MTTEIASPVSEGMLPAVELPSDAPESFDSPNAAAAYFTSLLEKPKKEQTGESADDATPEPELAQANAEPAEEQPIGEEPDAAEPAEQPPIEPPRSWTQEEKEAFKSWPREAQESSARIASAREAEFRRSQNEIAEQRKAIQAEREAAEKVRQQYEASLPALMKELESVNQASFADIKTMDDVVKLQSEDPFRFQAWQVHQMRLQAAKQENDRVTSERATAEQSNWAKHVQEENAKAAEFIPDLTDKVKGEALTKRVATELLPELGFTDSELTDLAVGKSKLSIYDHRVQRLLADAVKLRDIQKAPKAVAAKPVPPVQKPGTARSSSSSLNEQIQALSKELDKTGDMKTAEKLYALQARRAS